MISGGTIGRFFALTLIVFPALMDDWSQTTYPTPGKITSFATMDACAGKTDLIAGGFCDEGNNNENCGEKSKSAHTFGRTVTVVTADSLGPINSQPGSSLAFAFYHPVAFSSFHGKHLSVSLRQPLLKRRVRQHCFLDSFFPFSWPLSLEFAHRLISHITSIDAC